MVTLAVQATGIAIIATGMVLVIVSRNIDLSVGSLVGLIAMTYALLMTDIMPNILGMGADFPFRWLIALGLGVGLGAIVGAVQGSSSPTSGCRRSSSRSVASCPSAASSGISRTARPCRASIRTSSSSAAAPKGPSAGR